MTTTNTPAPPLAYAIPLPPPGPTAGTRVLRAVAGLALLPVAAFCAFGVRASGELPWAAAMPWALAYGATGAVALVGSGVLFYRAVAGPRRPTRLRA